MKRCTTCQRSFDDADQFCPHDGARLNPVPAEGVPTVNDPDRPTVVPPDPNLGPPPDEYHRYVGTVIDGRYEISELLGEGGMGVVFKGRHKLIEKLVAVKLLKAEVASDESVVQRFLQEAKAASRIGHPNIVDVTDFGMLADGTAYFVMEYISGVTLARAIWQAGGSFPLSRALPIIVQLARALGAAHGKGVIHRDLKPDNIFLVDRDGRQDIVKVVDFGIAKVAPVEGNLDGPRLTRVGSVFGTPEYMAPEQAAGRSDIDHRVDVYALGTIFYEMLVGVVPHRGESLVSTLAMQMLDPIDPPSVRKPELRLDPGIEGVIMTALAKEREMRFGSMEELVAALEAAAGPVPLDPLSGTGSVRAFRPTPGLGAESSQSFRIALGGGPAGATLKNAPEPEPGPTVPEPPPALMGPDTVRTANPDDATLAPDPSMLSPFRGVAAGVPARPSPVPSPPSPPPAPQKTPAEMVTAMPPPPAPGGKATGRAPPAAPDIPTVRPPGAVPPPPGVAPPAPRPFPVTPPSDRFAEPLPQDLRRGEGLGLAAKAALLLLLLVTSGVVAFVLLRKPDGGGEVAAAGSADAGALDPRAQASADAASGGDPADTDAGAGQVGPGPGIVHADAGPRGGGNGGKRPPAGPVSITLHTSPPGGTLLLDGRPVGREGSKLQRPRGTKLSLECQAPHHLPGYVSVVFDGKTATVTCPMVRRDRCNKELKNPFDPCPP